PSDRHFATLPSGVREPKRTGCCMHGRNGVSILTVLGMTACSQFNVLPPEDGSVAQEGRPGGPTAAIDAPVTSPDSGMGGGPSGTQPGQGTGTGTGAGPDASPADASPSCRAG